MLIDSNGSAHLFRESQVGERSFAPETNIFQVGGQVGELFRLSD